jgi:hypothetical protein
MEGSAFGKYADSAGRPAGIYDVVDVLAGHGREKDPCRGLADRARIRGNSGYIYIKASKDLAVQERHYIA